MASWLDFDDGWPREGWVERLDAHLKLRSATARKIYFEHQGEVRALAHTKASHARLMGVGHGQ